MKYSAIMILGHALRFAVKNEDHQAILSLLALGADPNAELMIYDKSITPLKMAVKDGDIEIVKILLQAGGDVSSPELLSFAVDSDDPIEMILFLSEMGANIKINGGEALGLAVHD